MLNEDQKYPSHKPLRLHDYDYSQAGCYFVTICTQDRKPWFGQIVNAEMRLSVAGSMVQSVWTSLPERFPDLQLDLFVVMPNHLHGLLLLTQQMRERPEKKALRPTVSRMVDLFKGAAASRIRATVARDFAWQRSFYDAIVRNPQMLEDIRHYIVNNPACWAEDTLHEGEDLS